MSHIFKKTMKFSFFTAVVIALAFVLQGRTGWAAGLLISVLWSVINFSATLRVLEIAILKQPPGQLSKVLFIKFPILYLVGFWILTSKFFPISSLLSGIGLTLAVIGIVTIWPKHT